MINNENTSSELIKLIPINNSSAALIPPGNILLKGTFDQLGCFWTTHNVYIPTLDGRWAKRKLRIPRTKSNLEFKLLKEKQMNSFKEFSKKLKTIEKSKK